MNKYVIVLFSLFLASCSFFDSKSAEVTFHIPDLPKEIQQLEVTSYRVVVVSMDGVRNHCSTGISGWNLGRT